jgi:hypothetical protein
MRPRRPYGFSLATSSLSLPSFLVLIRSLDLDVILSSMDDVLVIWLLNILNFHL